jgi:hypothetical protein
LLVGGRQGNYLTCLVCVSTGAFLQQESVHTRRVTEELKGKESSSCILYT